MTQEHQFDTIDVLYRIVAPFGSALIALTQFPGSSVGDEGLSLDDLDRVVEYKFHGGSRRQELQRAGRVMHSDGIGQHIVQMTDTEFEKFGQRLYSLEEKGMDIRVERRE